MLWQNLIKLELIINVCFYVSVDDIYIWEMLLNISNKYVIIYVSILTVCYDRLQWSHIWYLVLSSIIILMVYIYKRDYLIMTTAMVVFMFPLYKLVLTVYNEVRSQNQW